MVRTKQLTYLHTSKTLSLPITPFVITSYTLSVRTVTPLLSSARPPPPPTELLLEQAISRHRGDIAIPMADPNCLGRCSVGSGPGSTVAFCRAETANEAGSSVTGLAGQGSQGYLPLSAAPGHHRSQGLVSSGHRRVPGTPQITGSGQLRSEGQVCTNESCTRRCWPVFLCQCR